MFQFFVHLIKLLSISIKKSRYFSRTDKKCSDKAKYAKNMTNGLKSGPQGIFVNNIKIHCWKVTVSFLDFKIKHTLPTLLVLPTLKYNQVQQSDRLKKSSISFLRKTKRQNQRVRAYYFLIQTI